MTAAATTAGIGTSYSSPSRTPLIAEQAGRTDLATQLGWNVVPFKERLKLLKESRELYFSALKHLLKDFPDDEFGGVRPEPS